MLIIVDAYNYLKTIHHTSHVAYSIIAEHVFTFSDYVVMSDNEVMLIFDGVDDTFDDMALPQGLSLIYSGSWLSADDVIKKKINHYGHKDVLLVSSDRELCHYANQYNVVSIGSHDFHILFKQKVEKQHQVEQRISHDINKTSDGNDPYLDELMELSSRDLSKVDKDSSFDQVRLPSSGKASKLDKKLLKKINKI